MLISLLPLGYSFTVSGGSTSSPPVSISYSLLALVSFLTSFPYFAGELNPVPPFHHHTLKLPDVSCQDASPDVSFGILAHGSSGST